MIIETLRLLAGIHLVCGLIFVIPFLWRGVAVIDPHAAHGSWGFKLLIIPGTMIFWPLLAWRWARQVTPPEETNAHRRLARKAGSR